MKLLLSLIIAVLPWKIKCYFLKLLWGYIIHKDCRIGLSLILPKRLIMENGSKIGHLTVCKEIEEVKLGKNAIIGNLNWISGFPLGHRRHFVDHINRKPVFILEDEAAITNRHIIDCTDTVRIGKYSIVAGFRSQILTHSIDIKTARQTAAPVDIGEHCFIGTQNILLKGSSLPNYSILGAGSVLNKKFKKPYKLYSGIPAESVKELSKDLKYFGRKEGYIW